MFSQPTLGVGLVAAPIPSRFYLDPKIWYFVFLWTTNSILVSVIFLFQPKSSAICSHCQCCLSQPRKTTSKTPFLRFKTQVKGMPTVLSQYHCVIEITLKIVLKIIKSSEPERNQYSKKLGRSMPRLLSQYLIVKILVSNDIVVRPNVDSRVGRGIPCTDKQSKIKKHLLKKNVICFHPQWSL